MSMRFRDVSDCPMEHHLAAKPQDNGYDTATTVTERMMFESGNALGTVRFQERRHRSFLIT
jgi:hypothetical protein